jgi:hypothetical protein
MNRPVDALTAEMLPSAARVVLAVSASHTSPSEALFGLCKGVELPEVVADEQLSHIAATIAGLLDLDCHLYNTPTTKPRMKNNRHHSLFLSIVMV